MNKDILQKLNVVAKEQNLKFSFSEKDKNLTLKEIGLDSLATIGIIVRLENKLNVHIPDEVLAEIKTLKNLVDVFDDCVKKSK